MKKCGSLLLALFLVMALVACGQESGENLETEEIDVTMADEVEADERKETPEKTEKGEVVYLPTKHSVYLDKLTPTEVEHYEYDEFGRVVSYACNHWQITPTYDEDGKLVEELFYISGTLYNRNVLTYDGDTLVRETLYDKRLDAPSKVEYEYTDGEGGNVCVRALWYRSTGDLARAEEWEYNSQGQKVRENTVTYEYDQAGKLTRKNLDNAYYVVSYEGDMVTRIQSFDEDGNERAWADCVCDENGNIIECTEYGKNGMPTAREEFEYQAFPVTEGVVPGKTSLVAQTLKDAYSFLDFLE